MPPPPRAPQSKRPAACRGCSLDARGHGFVEPDGPTNAPILIMGEAPGYEEAALGRPFIGAAGSMLERILRRNRLNRGSFRVGNVLQCVPPGLVLEGQSFQHTAIDHCRVHRDKLLNEGHKVVVAAGATALKTLLGLHGQERIRVEEFHGTVHDDPEGRFQIVSTFHPSYLQRGAHNLIGTVSFDMQVALEVARGEWQRDPIETIIDPPTDWFEAWVGQLEQAAQHDPEGVAIASDIETPDKAGGKPENELTPDDDSYTITRFNFACHPDQGVTVPYLGPFIPLIDRVLTIRARHYWWNGYGYDWARVAAAGHVVDPRFQIDLMIAAHILQSDVPLGLGFWAPFYSRFGAWKHLSGVDPELYACLDGPQTLRTGYGIIGDLLSQGQWRAFEEDCHELYHYCLKPAQDIGILIDRPALQTFHEDLATKQRRLLHEMQGTVPEALRVLSHETAREPEAGVLHPAARTTNLRTGELKKDQPDPIKQDLYSLAAVRVKREVTRTILCCQACGAQEVHKKHRCKRGDGKIDKDRTPRLEMVERPVVRWFWQEPFNPDSPKQMLAYITAMGHKPGRSKKTKEDSADRETLIRLSRSTKDPFYQINLDYRGVKKIDSTYAIPTMRRVDKELAEGREGRLHPIPTFRPSTMRLCVAAGTLIEILRDVDAAPLGVPIEEVRAGDWAYTYDTACHLTLRQVVSTAQTGIKRVVRVHWHGGRNRKPGVGYVDLTAEHEVRLTTGEYKAAGTLVPGDRVLALSRGRDKQDNRPLLYATGKLQPLQEHRFAYCAITGTSPQHVHHKNERVGDNRLDNLIGRATGAHLRIHNTGSRNGRWNPTSPHHQRDKRRAERQRAKVHNHTILRVEPRTVAVPVFDLEIEGTHNFIAGEVCVHNSYVSPNITNVTQDKGGKANLAAGFRKCVIASPGCRLLEVDYSGIEAVETGWFARDPAYIRLAKLGVHAYLASHLLGRPADLAWSDHDLLAYFGSLKKAHALIYDQAKRCVHGTNYGLTPYGMASTFPDLYKDDKAAERVQKIYFEICPALPAWHAALRQQAYDAGCLGGPGEVLLGADNACYKPGWKGASPWPHPFQYRHWFWSVLAYSPITEAQHLRRAKQGRPSVDIQGRWFAVNWGEDSKRVIAFYPQSTASGVLKRSARALFAHPDHPSYIGDAYHGRTPFRAPIHDSLLLEVPDRAWDRVYERVCREMLRPISEQPLPAVWGMGSHLQVGIAAKVGRNWLEMEEITVPTLAEETYFGSEESDEEDAMDLGIVA